MIVFFSGQKASPFRLCVREERRLLQPHLRDVDAVQGQVGGGKVLDRRAAALPMCVCVCACEEKNGGGGGGGGGGGRRFSPLQLARARTLPDNPTLTGP